MDGLGRQLVVAVDEDVDVGLDVAEGGPDGEALALARFADDPGAGGDGDRDRLVGGAVVDDPDGGFGQLAVELGHDRADRQLLVEARDEDGHSLGRLRPVRADRR